MADLVRDLVKAEVDIILAGDTEAAVFAREGTEDHPIPIVVAITGDKDRATGGKEPQDGGWVTGQTHRKRPDAGKKRLAILKAVFDMNDPSIQGPKTLKGVAVIWNEGNSGAARAFQMFKDAASRAKIGVVEVPIRDDEEIEDGGKLGGVKTRLVANKSRFEAVLVIDDPKVFAHHDMILPATVDYPTLYDIPDSVKTGGGLVAWGDPIQDELDDGVKMLDKVVKVLEKRKHPGTRLAYLPRFQTHARSKVVLSRSAASRFGFTVAPPALTLVAGATWTAGPGGLPWRIVP